MKCDSQTPPGEFLLEALRMALGGICGGFADGKVSVWDYSNSEHFRMLWNALSADGLRKPEEVLIVWSRTLADEALYPVNTCAHVSPLHWAACAAVDTKTGEPETRTAVLDLNPKAHQNEYLYEHHQGCDQRHLSWLTVLQAADLFGDVAPTGGSQSHAGPTENKILRKRLFPEIQAGNYRIQSSSFWRRIRDELSTPHNAENRHAISNIIGPIILRGGRSTPANMATMQLIDRARPTSSAPSGTQSADHVPALNRVLRAAELLNAQRCGGHVPAGAEESTGWLVIAATCSDLGINPAELRITVVDDQWHHGWLAWIQEGVGGVPVHLQVSSDPTFLIPLLKSAAPFGLEINGSGSVAEQHGNGCARKHDILLLDLRLFSSDPAAERAFASKLLDTLATLEANTTSPAGKQKIRDDVVVVRSRILLLAPEFKGVSSDEKLSGMADADYARYLTILPRLIAQADFSLPIIMFSSTGRLDITRYFDDYENIITAFSKPRHFQGVDDEVVTRAERALSESFASALRLLRGRQLIDRIRSRRLDALARAKHRCSGCTHFELYFDESGQAHSHFFRCAGLLVGFRPGTATVEDSDAVLVSENIANGGVKLWDESSGKQPRDVNHVCQQWDSDSPKLENALGDRPIIPFILSRSPRIGQPVSDLDLAHPDCLDNALFDLAELLLELVLVEVLPAICPDLRTLTFNVYGATRMKEVILDSRSEYEAVVEVQIRWQQMEDRFGFSGDKPVHNVRNDGRWSFLYRSLWGDSFWPILTRALGHRSQSRYIASLRKATRRVKAVMLIKGQRPAPEVRHQHYICDRLALFSEIPSEVPDSVRLGRLEGWRPIVESGIGYLGRRNRVLLDLLDSGRHLDAGEFGWALFLGRHALETPGLLAEALLSRLKDALADLSSESFQELCSLLDEKRVSRSGPPASADRYGSACRSASPIPTAQPGKTTKPKREVSEGIAELGEILDRELGSR